MAMFEGFTLTTIKAGEIEVRLRHGGSGPPLLLLHGHPQTHVMWHRIAGELAQRALLAGPVDDLPGDTPIGQTASSIASPVAPAKAPAKK